MLQSLRELFQQKLAFDFTAARCCPVLLHKIKMLKPLGPAVEVFAHYGDATVSSRDEEVRDAVNAAENG